ncbi:hypothetical protein N9928_00615 [bacterium]|nr:hypothetical protein [bacterium]
MSEPVITTLDTNDWAREQSRRRLMSLLDISPLVSCYDPPGAAPATRAFAPAAPIEAGSESGNSLAARDGKSNSPSAAADQPSLSVASSAKATTPSPAVGNTSAAVLRPESRSVQFSLLMVSAGEWLWIETLPDRLLRQAQVNLIKAMASAISGGDCQANYRQFDWPMTDNPHLAQDLETGRESVAGLLMRMQREVKAKGVILMGDEVSEFCPTPANLVQHTMPSTLQILEHPLLKIDVWKTLRPLIQTPAAANQGR